MKRTPLSSNLLRKIVVTVIASSNGTFVGFERARSAMPRNTSQITKVKDGYCNEISQHDKWKLVEEELSQLALARSIGVSGSFAGQGRPNVRIDGDFQRDSHDGYHLHEHDVDNNR